MALTSKLAMGLSAAATCPSQLQLQGVTDCTDPCQVNSTPCTSQAGSASGAYTTISTPSGDYQVLANGQVLDPNGNVINTAASSVQGSMQSGINYLTSLVSQGSQIIPGVQNIVVYGAVGVLFLVLLLSGGGGRRR
jgi:hypothetical protein